MTKQKQRESNKPAVSADTREDDAAETARLVLRPSIKGAVTIHNYSKTYGELNLAVLVDELAAQAKAANDGDLKCAEGMLMVQAHTLDSIFNTLASRAIKSEYVSQLESILRLALKAQSQCARTLETLAAMKNPQPVAFVKQANIAHGPQQVNNGAAVLSPAREIENAPNELLEVQPSEQPDKILRGPFKTTVPLKPG
jgi:hypothetical protein